MALGVKRMAANHAIVRKLAALEVSPDSHLRHVHTLTDLLFRHLELSPIYAQVAYTLGCTKVIEVTGM